VTKQKKLNRRKFQFLILLLFSTSLISLKTFKKVYIRDIKISGSKIFSQDDLVKNSSLKLPTHLILIKTNLLEKELKENLSLKNIFVSRQIFPFGLKVQIQTRTPIAYGERILGEKKILGFIDKDGVFINKKNIDEKFLRKFTLTVFGWEKKFQKRLSKILSAQDAYGLELIKIVFSPNGFLTIEEKELKTIYLGFNPNLINYQLEIIRNLRYEFNRINFSEKIENIDLSDPNKPKIKVFKP
tara:strand:- start:14 stop:739 length:726 start_codon:yes stop_codon:yes gene_type:complete